MGWLCCVQAGRSSTRVVAIMWHRFGAETMLGHSGGQKLHGQLLYGNRVCTGCGARGGCLIGPKAYRIARADSCGDRTGPGRGKEALIWPVQEVT